MTIWWLAAILASLGSIAIAFIWLAVRIGNAAAKPEQVNPIEALEKTVNTDVEHLFDRNFREELRNRGRLHFEKIIGENAMFLQQDLRLTTSQLNEYMKTEITKKLEEEFQKYEQSIMDAKQLAVDSIEKTNIAVEEQRKLLSQQLQQEIQAEKLQLIKHFENNMADIVNHYILAAVGDQIDLNDQLEYILTAMEANKQAIIEDITNGS